MGYNPSSISLTNKVYKTTGALGNEHTVSSHFSNEIPHWKPVSLYYIQNKAHRSNSDPMHILWLLLRGQLLGKEGWEVQVQSVDSEILFVTNPILGFFFFLAQFSNLNGKPRPILLTNENTFTNMLYATMEEPSIEKNSVLHLDLCMSQVVEHWKISLKLNSSCLITLQS